MENHSLQCVTTGDTNATNLNDNINELANELISDGDGKLSPNHHLYYSRISFDEATQIRQKKQILKELHNAFNIKNTRPTYDQIGSTDATVNLIIETAIEPENIIEALTQEGIDNAILQELDPATFDIEISRETDDRSFNSSEEFNELQEKWGPADEPESDAEKSDLGNPEEISFSDDEIPFSELIETKRTADTNLSVEHIQNQETVVSALVTELEAGVTDSDDIATLRKHLSQFEPQTSTEVQLNHVQSQVETLTAYVDALEEFLDEEGTAQQLLNDLRSRIDTIEDELQAAATEREALRSRLDTLETEAVSESEFQSEIQRVDQSFERLAEEYQERVKRIESRVNANEETLEDQEQWREKLQDAFVPPDPIPEDEEDN